MEHVSEVNPTPRSVFALDNLFSSWQLLTLQLTSPAQKAYSINVDDLSRLKDVWKGVKLLSVLQASPLPGTSVLWVVLFNQTGCCWFSLKHGWSLAVCLLVSCSVCGVWVFLCSDWLQRCKLKVVRFPEVLFHTSLCRMKVVLKRVRVSLFGIGLHGVAACNLPLGAVLLEMTLGAAHFAEFFFKIII